MGTRTTLALLLVTLAARLLIRPIRPDRAASRTGLKAGRWSTYDDRGRRGLQGTSPAWRRGVPTRRRAHPPDSEGGGHARVACSDPSGEAGIASVLPPAPPFDHRDSCDGTCDESGEGRIACQAPPGKSASADGTVDAFLAECLDPVLAPPLAGGTTKGIPRSSTTSCGYFTASRTSARCRTCAPSCCDW